MKKILLTIIIGMFLISFTTAAISELGAYKINSCIELPQSCPDCTYNNISNILYPNSSIAVAGITMSKNNTLYNYTFCSTGALGKYIVNGYGDRGGTLDTWEYNLLVTRSGEVMSTPTSILYVIILIVSSFLFVLCLNGAISTPWKKPTRDDSGRILDISYLKYLKVILWFFSYMLLIWITNIMILITNNFLVFDVAFTFFRIIFFILLGGFFPVAVGTLFVIVMNFITDKKIKKMINRGIYPR